ncbi:MAG TPA: VOC family protein [Pirellulaceae bacterium]|nr:VOC family protein [Pirellulaceae bacterium]
MTESNISRRQALQIVGVAAIPGITMCCGDSLGSAASETAVSSESDAMDLGAFSISLAVKDLRASQEFYEKFGFKAFAGEPSQNWIILKNGDHVIGLFQGMFEKNILTFNPGWDQHAQKLEKFTDVRELQRQLKAQGVKLISEADETTTGPASFIALDPDGNPILIDQHV